MDKRAFIKTIGLLGLGGAIASTVAQNNSQDNNVSGYLAKHQQDYEAILKRGSIKAGYIILPPEFQKDPATGILSGIAHDIAMLVAATLSLKIEWVEETSFATLSEGLGHRFDALFFTLYRSTAFARAADFTQAFFYSGHSAYVRADDARFTNAVERLDSEDIVISTKDGDISGLLASQRFPRARQISLPSHAEHSQMLLDVLAHKADAALVNTIAADKFLQQHPQQLKNLTADEPLAVHGHAFVVAKGQYFLRELFDIALAELAQSGAIDAVLSRYEPFAGAYLRAAAPYSINASTTERPS